MGAVGGVLGPLCAKICVGANYPAWVLNINDKIKSIRRPNSRNLHAPDTNYEPLSRRALVQLVYVSTLSRQIFGIVLQEEGDVVSLILRILETTAYLEAITNFKSSLSDRKVNE